jgi:hypothetical protein
MTEELNFKAICSLTTRVMGLPDGSLSLKSRKRELQLSRSIAAYIGLTEENINRYTIAKVLNRDRSLTYHYEKTHEKYFKTSNAYRKIFSKIYKKYLDADGEKEIFIKGTDMKAYLLQNKVNESRKSDVKLEIKSGKAKCFIYTTYFDFSNQLENISLAMKNYHYTVKII